MIETAKHKHKEFTEHSEKGKEFIKLYNKTCRGGDLKKIADHFEMSVYTVRRIRIKLNLLAIHDLNNPGKRDLFKRIKKLYWKGRSTSRIGTILKMSPENVRHILISQNIVMNPSHCINPKYFKTSSELSPWKILQVIKHEYTINLKSANQIASELGINEGTVSTKLKAMNIPLRHNIRRGFKGGWTCQWCGQVMNSVWQKKGIRKQKFCSSSCSCKAKDYRRYNKGIRLSESRFVAMDLFLKETWQGNYSTAVQNLLNVVPCIKYSKKGCDKNSEFESEIYEPEDKDARSGTQQLEASC